MSNLQKEGKLKVVFFGTPAFAATVLKQLISHHIQIVGVVTKPDKPKGRSLQMQPSAVKILALSEGLPVLQPAKASHPDFVEILKQYQPDLLVVVAYSEILKENLLRLPKRGCINVHASLLPKYRGAAPIQRCIMEGEKESGVTIMAMAPELDAGDILAVAKTPIPDDMTAGELSVILSQLGAEALLTVLDQYEKGEASPIPQEAALATYARKLKAEDGEVDFRLPAKVVHDRIRGVTPKPGAWCWILLRGKKNVY